MVRNLTRDRRGFASGSLRAGTLLAGLVAGLGVMGSLAHAQSASDDQQAEWAQRYDADPKLQVQRSTTPILSPQTVAATEQAIQNYQGIVAEGRLGAGARRHQPARRLQGPGRRGAAPAARRRSGDLDEAAGMSPVFDTYVEAGVKRFQARHGLGADRRLSSRRPSRSSTCRPRPG